MAAFDRDMDETESCDVFRSESLLFVTCKKNSELYSHKHAFQIQWLPN